MLTATPLHHFLSLINNKRKFRLFLLQKLPAAFFSGLQVTSLNEEACTVSVPYKWFTQNPFRSTYFACLAMAAEMSTGVLAMAHLYKRQPAVSMLIVGMESKFYKKAIGKTFFTCTDGEVIKTAIEQSVLLNTGQTVRVYSKGVNESGELIAEFWFTWSFKPKQKG
jgi:hypothetical protein